MAGKVIERDLGWKRVKLTVAELGLTTVRVGVLESAPMHRDPRTGKLRSMAEIAVIHEYGSPSMNIPMRSFVRSAIDENKAVLVALETKAANAALFEKVTVQEALSIVGEKTRALIQKKIVDGPFAPNAPRTIARKGSSKPLIDTSQLRQSISYELAKKEGEGEDQP